MSDPDVPSVTAVEGTGIPIRGNDIDTDQIIPGRFLKVLTFDGLGQFAFFDQRFEDAEPDGTEDVTAVEVEVEKDHPMNDSRFQEASIMVVNANFGCGSSREHAPQALMRWGIDAIVGESFAEIFRGNCLALGIPTVTADEAAIEALQDHIATAPDTTIHVDVADEQVSYAGTTIEAAVDEGQRKALVEGIWDTTALMRSNRDEIRRTAASLPYVDGSPGDGSSASAGE